MQDRETGGINLQSSDGVSGPPQNRRVKPQAEQPQKCPRCDSLNTKFCYYNNYSLSQPRYFCKTCRRYWTKGGTLRNVPVGGGCRKGGKRPKRLVPDNPTAGSPNQDRKPNFLTPIFSAIRPQFLMDQSSTGVKLSAGVSSLSSLPFSHGMTMGDYVAILNTHQEPLIASAPQQTPPVVPNDSGVLVNDIGPWRVGDAAAEGSIAAKDGLLHLLPPFPSSGIAGNGAAASGSGSPALKTETQTVYDSYWNSSGSSLVGGQWQNFPGYGPFNSFL